MLSRAKHLWPSLVALAVQVIRDSSLRSEWHRVGFRSSRAIRPASQSVSTSTTCFGSRASHPTGKSEGLVVDL